MFFWGGKKMKGAESIENEKLSIFAQYTLAADMAMSLPIQSETLKVVSWLIVSRRIRYDEGCIFLKF
jgi:hypothetical protein